VRFTAIVLAIALLIVTGCEGDSTGPTTKEFNEERKALMAKLKDKAKKAPVVAKKKTVAKAPVDPTFAAVGRGFVYDPTGLRDPFRSFTWEERNRRELNASMRGPLEQYDINQLSVLGVVWKTGSARALVQDPAGKSYIIGKGTRIGKNDGRVIDIGDNQVVVKETYVDFLGKETTKDIEMRIRRSEGG
jgi:type IV pilus assembly protein PilP